MIHTKYIDISWRPVMGWRFRIDEAWGAKRFGCQLGYLLIAIWR